MSKPQPPYGIEKHYKDFDEYEWLWGNFSPKELSSKSDGLLLLHKESLDKLQAFRESVGVPFSPNSAYRSEAHNKRVGGALYSQHRLGRAFDIPIKTGMSREAIHNFAKQVGFTGFGDYNTFVHIDTGKSRYWDNRG